MYFFQNDYNEVCIPQILERMNTTAKLPMTGYGIDGCCRRAAELICRECRQEELPVHFLVGGTQTNLTVLAAALRPYQAVVAPHSAHISEHETGAIEATGHRILELPTEDGKITATQVAGLLQNHLRGEGPGVEHTVQPKLVYISQPTELGTLYCLSELEALREVCNQYGLYLYVDGARLGYGITARGNDVTLPDLARLCDAFYIGGTKQGTMFGEAVVIPNAYIAQDFRFMIKQRGGMLAKGWLLGLQFEVMFEDGLYYKYADRANRMADQIRQTLTELGYPLTVDCTTNQVFTTMPDTLLDTLSQDFMFTEWNRADEAHRSVRFCTGWSTAQESVDALCSALRNLSK